MKFGERVYTRSTDMIDVKWYNVRDEGDLEGVTP